MNNDTLLFKLKPILDLIPEVRNSSSNLAFKDKILWTGIVLFIYLICCQIPLYGIFMTSTSDPLYYMRVILASNRGTLMELGISPLITSNMVIELFANTKMLSVNSNNPVERRLLGKMEKVLSFIVAFTTSFIYVWSGMYGDISYIGVFKAFSIVIQLTLAGIVVIYLDELPQKGYGIGSGVSLFIATNICETIIWKSLSPITLNTENGIEFEGIVISLFHFLITKPNKLLALKLAFYRSYLPNFNNLLATIFIFCIVIYLQGFQVNIKVQSREHRGMSNTIPIKLFYLSNTPIILQTALVGNLHVISSLLYQKFKSFSLIRLLGVWKENADGSTVCISGLAYYLTPPNSFSDIIFNPAHFFIYCLIVIVSCGLFSKFWLEISGRSSVDMLRDINNNKMMIAGYKEKSMIKILNKNIPIAAVLGGVVIAILSIISDLLGCIGSGTGLLLLVNIIYSYFEAYKKEKSNDIRSIVDNY